MAETDAEAETAVEDSAGVDPAEEQVLADEGNSSKEKIDQDLASFDWHLYEEGLDEIDNNSFVQKLPQIIKSTEIVWQSLLPEETGEATVTVRLEDEDGNLLSGRVLTVQNRADLFTRLRISIGAIFLVGAGIAIISPILPLFTSLLGL